MLKQVEAVKTVNAQFTSVAITDSVLDTKAKIKNDAKFTDITTGNTDLDKVLAISLGKRASNQRFLLLNLRPPLHRLKVRHKLKRRKLRHQQLLQPHQLLVQLYSDI